MLRFRRLIVLTLISALLGGSGYAAAASHGVLTRTEFRQLQLAQRRIRSLVSSDARSTQQASAVCTHLRQVSRLIAAVRSGCLDLIRLGGDDNRLNARATRCGIDPGSERALLSCLVPAVRRYYADAESFYQAESRVDQLARARGFGTSCVAEIGDSPGNLAAESRLAQALRSAVGALQQQNADALQTLFNQLQTDIRSIRPGRGSLALCPHR